MCLMRGNEPIAYNIKVTKPIKERVILLMRRLTDWIEFLHPVMQTSSYVRCLCKGHGVG